MSSSILNLFLQGDGSSGACSGSIASWLCIAVPQRSAHFPTFNHPQIKTSNEPRLSLIKQVHLENFGWLPSAAELQTVSAGESKVQK